ncbi:hypothetical protein [Arthrobacter globiformis]|uniref:hypothetical protein n=1 Tax=Arthrobacter globiformis TaxID=1665 RepID=UPI002794C42E|nr:hypothetical protein [Arthrobacter globiformis]MDQ0616688.1 hypothetical protein [Arthrobacter globiformis]
MIHQFAFDDSVAAKNALGDPAHEATHNCHATNYPTPWVTANLHRYRRKAAAVAAGHCVVGRIDFPREDSADDIDPTIRRYLLRSPCRTAEQYLGAQQPGVISHLSSMTICGVRWRPHVAAISYFSSEQSTYVTESTLSVACSDLG